MCGITFQELQLYKKNLQYNEDRLKIPFIESTNIYYSSQCTKYLLFLGKSTPHPKKKEDKDNTLKKLS